jgi:hypothetical protein
MLCTLLCTLPLPLGTAQGIIRLQLPKGMTGPLDPEAPRADRRRGRIGAATQRSLTVNHGVQRTGSTAVRQLYSAVMGLLVHKACKGSTGCRPTMDTTPETFSFHRSES